MEKKLQIIVSIFAILGISIGSVMGTLVEHLPCMQRYKAEQIVEKIRVTESKEYIESVLGIPQQTLEFNYKDDKGISLLGKKSVFVANYYTFIIYFNNSDDCIGYFLICNDRKFSPKLYYEENLFNLNISKSEIFNLGYLYSIAHFANNRSDCSSFHIQYYTHHLALNGCYVGLGFSNLGEINGKAIQTIYDYSQEWNNGYMIVEKERRNEIELLEETFINMKPNVFSVFLANGTYDVDDLLRAELNMHLALSHIDLRILK